MILMIFLAKAPAVKVEMSWAKLSCVSGTVYDKKEAV